MLFQDKAPLPADGMIALEFQANRLTEELQIY